MPTVLQFFLNEENIITALDYPDTAIDYVYMLKPKDWQKLGDDWDNHSNSWKEGIAYLAGFIPLKETSIILLKAFYENESLIKTQALIAIYQSLSEELEETNKFTFKFQITDKDNILKELQQRAPDYAAYPEFKELRMLLEK
jgi:hypothetical protein